MAAVVSAADSAAVRPAPHFVSGGKADQAEGARILGEFHQMGLAGNYMLGFELRVLPRKGAERTIRGQLFGSRNAAGPITRLTLLTASDAAEARWLIQGGPAPAAWHWSGATGQTAALTAADAFQPIGGTDLTLFDLQLSFLYWKDFVYEGVARVRGRPAHSFLLYPPADVAAARPGLTGMRVMLDTQFQQLVQAEQLGKDGTAEKTITILDLKKSGEQWMVKSIDVRNSVTRDKTRFDVTAAALGLTLPEVTFTPDALAHDSPAVPEAKIDRF